MLQLQKMFMFLWQDNNYFMGCGNPQEKIFEHIQENLLKVGCTQLEVNSCFISENAIWTLFYSPNEIDSDIVLEKLRQLKMEFN